MGLPAIGDIVNGTLAVATHYYLIDATEARELSITLGWAGGVTGQYAIEATNFPEIEANKTAGITDFWNSLISPTPLAAGPNTTLIKPATGHRYYRLRLLITGGGAVRARLHQVR